VYWAIKSMPPPHGKCHSIINLHTLPKIISFYNQYKAMTAALNYIKATIISFCCDTHVWFKLFIFISFDDLWHQRLCFLIQLWMLMFLYVSGPSFDASTIKCWELSTAPASARGREGCCTYSVSLMYRLNQTESAILL
jgi:hypothetical protein